MQLAARSRPPRSAAARARRPAPEERERADRPELPPHQRHERPAADEVGVGALAVAAVAVAHGDRSRQRPGDAGRRRSGRLLCGHAARDHRWRAVLALDDHHRRVDAVDLHRGVEDAIHQLLEVDRVADLAEEAVPATLLLRPLERAGKPAGEFVHLAPHLVDGADELFVRGCARDRRAPAPRTPTRTAAATRAAAMITIVVARCPASSSETTLLVLTPTGDATSIEVPRPKCTSQLDAHGRAPRRSGRGSAPRRRRSRPPPASPARARARRGRDRHGRRRSRVR